MSRLLGLTKSINTTDAAIRDLSILERMDQRVQQDKDKEVQAQQAEQMLMERMYSMSDQLLEKDRNAINKRFRMAQRQLRDSIKRSGGTKRRFMEDGGLSVINNMSNELMRSPEAVRYQENKKNLAKILEAKDKGFGHLLTPQDLKSLEDYENSEEGGQITYSGLMNAIELPPTEAFDYGHQMTPEEILSYGSNAIKIKANYALANPNKGEPNWNQLVSFMAQQGYGGYGTNTTTLRMKMQQRMLAQTAKNNAKTKKENNENSFVGRFSEVSAMLHGTTPQDIIDKYGNNMIEKMKADNPSLAKVIQNKNNLTAYKHVMDEEGMDFHLGFDGPTWGAKIFNNRYGLKESYEFMPESKMQIAKAIYGGDEGYEFKNGMLLDYDPALDTDLYRMDGEQITGSNELADDEYKDNYKVAGVYTAFRSKGTGGKGNVLLMNAYNNDGTLDEDETAKIDDGYKGDYGGSGSEFTTVIALQHPKNGNIFYKEVDLSKVDTRTKVATELGDVNNIAPEVQQENESFQIRQYMEQISDKEQIMMKDNMNTLEKTVYQDPSFENEGVEYYGTGSAGEQNRFDMMKSFYTAANFLMNKGNITQENPNGDPNVYGSQIKNLIDNRYFSMSAIEAGIEDDLKDYNKTPEEIINNWTQNMNNDPNLSDRQREGNQQLAAKWLQLLELMQN